MAYASPRSYRGPAPRGGGGNVTAMAIAAVLVLGGIVAVIAMSGGKEKPEPKKAPPPVVAPVVAPVVKPTGPQYPPMPQAKVEEANRLVRTFPERAVKAQKLYDESRNAKVAGNEAEWQSKLRDARQLLDQINDEWNEFLAGLPTNKDYDQEQVAAYYLRAQSGEVAKHTKLLRVMKSDQR